MHGSWQAEFLVVGRDHDCEAGRSRVAVTLPVQPAIGTWRVPGTWPPAERGEHEVVQANCRRRDEEGEAQKHRRHRVPPDAGLGGRKSVPSSGPGLSPQPLSSLAKPSPLRYRDSSLPDQVGDEARIEKLAEGILWPRGRKHARSSRCRAAKAATATLPRRTRTTPKSV